MPNVHDILQHKGSEIHAITPESTVLAAIREMAATDVGALVVVEKDEVCGIISERDYVRKVTLEGRSPDTTRVATIMSSPVVVVHESDSLDHCMAVMTKQRCRHLPVVDEKDALIGMISVGDVIKQIAEDQEQEIKFLREYMGGPEYDPGAP